MRLSDLNIDDYQVVITPSELKAELHFLSQRGIQSPNHAKPSKIFWMEKTSAYLLWLDPAQFMTRSLHLNMPSAESAGGPSA
jgi:hypothetical protein